MNEPKISGQKRSHTAFALLLISLLLILAASIVLSMSFGDMDIAPSHVYAILLEKLFGVTVGGGNLTGQLSEVNIIWEIRLPRVLLGVAAGAGLSLCGMVMQAAVQNPLAEPYILGISSGASLGATFSLLLGIGSFQFLAVSGVAFWGFLGAISATVAVLSLASAGSKMTSTKLVLAGTVINALCTALSNFIIFMASNAEGMQDVKFWTMGSLAGAKWGSIGVPMVVCGLSVVFFSLQYRPLNTMLLGDEAAVTLGLNIVGYRRIYMLVCAILTGVLVANCGIIGFVGLIIPHIMRSLTGADHRRLTPLCVLGGAIFLVWADAFARSAIQNSQLPIGIVTALVGAPFFVYILVRKSYTFHGN